VSAASEQELTLEDHERALTELSFLIDMFTRTARELMGGATATVARAAGRHLGRKMPVYLQEPELTSVLDAIAGYLRNGFELEVSASGPGAESAELAWGRCAIRELCRRHDQELGGELCQMFHHFMAGVIDQLLGMPVRTRILSAGDACRTHVELR
jgi:hypothetical protein